MSLLLAVLVLTGARCLRVLTSNWPPMSRCELGQSNFSGFDIDLLQAIEEDLGREKFEFRCVERADLLAGLDAGEGDLAASGITITSENVQRYLFSSPTFLSGLQLVILEAEADKYWLLFEPFATSLWIAIFATGVCTAHALWIHERQDNPCVSMEYRTGILTSLWLTISTFFSAVDHKIVTVPGRLILVGYYFISLVLFADYISELTARLASPLTNTSIKDYSDLANKRVGALRQYEAILLQFDCQVKTYEDSETVLSNMIRDLKAGEVDALALEYPVAIMASSGDCRLTTTGGIVVPWFYAFAFPATADAGVIRNISYTNLRLYQQHFHTSLQNLNMIQTPDEVCEYIISKPLEIHMIAGFWVVCSAFLGGFPLLYLCYRKCVLSIDVESTEIHGNVTKSNGPDFKSAAKMDLITKFEKILSGSDRKFKQKMKDLECALEQHNESSDLFEDSLIELSSKLHSRDT